MKKDEVKNAAKSTKDTTVNPGPSVPTTPPKIKACEGKKRGDPCSFITSTGSISHGKCVPQHIMGSKLYCSNLNKDGEEPEGEKDKGTDPKDIDVVE